MERNRAWRREQGKRVQRKRYLVQKAKRGLFDVGDEFWLDKDNLYGRLRKNHTGCGCPCCKPWKHGWEDSRSKEKREWLDYGLHS